MANPESDNYVPPPLPDSKVPYWQAAPRPGEKFSLTQQPHVLFVTGYDREKDGWIVMTALGEFTIKKAMGGDWTVIGV